MAIFSKRPLFTACFIFLSFAVLGYFVSPATKVIIMAVSSILLVTAVVLVICRKLKNYSSLLIILSLIAIAGASLLSLLHFDIKAKSYQKYYGAEHTISATVIEERFDGGNLCGYLIEVDTVDGKRDTHKAVLECYYNAALEVGDKVTLLVNASFPESNSGARYNEHLSLLSDGIFITYESYDESASTILSKDIPSLKILFSSLNSRLSKILTYGIQDEEGKLASAILLGNRDLLSNSTIRDFSRAGVSHILAISGLHMSILMGALMMLLKKLHMRNRTVAIIMSALALFYLALTGFSISATRSVIMLTFVYLSMIANEQSDPLTSLSLAGVIIVLISPGSILDGGFWMSFSATLGILSFMPSFNKFANNAFYRLKDAAKWFKPIRAILSALAAGIFAIIPLIIVMCVFIKEMSWFSVISSAILSLPTSLIIILSLIFIPFAKVPYMSYILASSIKWFATLMISFCEKISDIEGVVFSLNYSFSHVFALIIGAGLLCALVFKSRNVFIALIPYVTAVALFAGAIFAYEINVRDAVKITYLNCSAKSDMLVLSNEREAIICDIGNGSNSAFNKAYDEVYNARATEIKSVILTHYENSYTSSLLKLFTKHKVRELWLPKPTNQEDYSKMLPIVDIASAEGVKVKVYDIGSDLTAFTYLNIQVDTDYIERSKEEIVLISINSRGERLTYASPAFNESDLFDIANQHFTKSDYIVFGNKGAKTKTTYSIPKDNRVKAIAFADDVNVAYFNNQDGYDALCFLVPEKIDFYIEK